MLCFSIPKLQLKRKKMSKYIKGAIIGRPQIGKTAFINSMLELYGTPHRLSEIPNMKRGEVVTTTSHKYCLKLAELPDPSFLDFMAKTRYPRQFKLKDYDFFVIFVELRVEENIKLDQWLINYIKKEIKKPYFLVQSNMDNIVSSKAYSVQMVYQNASDEMKDKVRRASFSDVRGTLAQHYPEEKIYLVGQDLPNSRLAFEFPAFMEATATFRRVPEEMAKEEEPIYDVLKNRIADYAINTDNVGASFQDYVTSVIKLMEDEPLPTVNGCVIGVSGVGKSSFINSFVGSYVASEGVVQTTMEPRSYQSRMASLVSNFCNVLHFLY